MIEIYRNLYIGSDQDVSKWDGPYIIHAAKDPWFSNLGLSPRILTYKECGELTLNLVDARSAAYIPLEIIELTLDYIHERINNKILLHCNAGLSRSATIGFIYMLKYTDIFKDMDLNDASKKYLEIYPNWSPGPGMSEIACHYFKLFNNNTNAVV